MLIGINKNHDNLLQMSKSTIRVHLTGSRSNNTASPESDWDFFVGADEPNLAAYLGELGFKLQDRAEKKYNDISCLDVWRHEEAKIDVQVIKPEKFAAKSRANRFFQTQTGVELLATNCKMSRRQIWNDVIKSFDDNEHLVRT